MAAERAADSTEPEDGSIRRVQRTGGSSLAITLPKSWTDAMKVVPGDALRVRDLGEGRLTLDLEKARSVHHGPGRVLRIDVREALPSFVARLLVGAYITGQDQVIVSSDKPLPEAVRDEVRRTSQHILGMSIVEEAQDRMRVQIFIDPTKHPLSSLLDGVARMLHLELETCTEAVSLRDAEVIDRLETVEEEIDRFYQLIVRQLLLSSDDFRAAREIGIPSHHFQIGSRVVAKMLEMIGDLIGSIGSDLRPFLAEKDGLSGEAQAALREMFQAFDALLQQTTRAFAGVSAHLANQTLNDLPRLAQERRRARETLGHRRLEKRLGLLLERITATLDTADEMLRIINEITINRAVEPETVARTDGFAVIVE